MGNLSAFDLINHARSRGLDLAACDGKLRITGPKTAGEDIIEQLRERRDDIIGALTHSPRICAHCGSDQVAITSWAGEPYCRPCAIRVGTELLAAESPWILERQWPTLDDTPPPAPPGCQADPHGNLWAIQCHCGHHQAPGQKGHDAAPVNHMFTEQPGDAA